MAPAGRVLAPAAGYPVYTTDLPLDAARQALADATPEQTARWRS